jgi:ribose transport system ATP-binding protein
VLLDEPTAALPAAEVRHLFDLLNELKRQGVAILYVTHRLPEVFALADRVSVLRSGRMLGTYDVKDLDTAGLIEMITGQSLEQAEHRSSIAPGRVALSVNGIAGGNVANATFDVRAGEILGLTGLIGSGYESVLAMVFGAEETSRGTVTLNGTELGRLGPNRAIAAGLVYAPADRRRYGAITEMTLRENLTLPRIDHDRRTGGMSPRAERADAERWLKLLSVQPDDSEARFSLLSGGNQQKVVLARWLRCAARAILLDEPTFGVDAGAKQAIYTELRAAADNGAAICIASSDTEELSEVCDRVIVMGDGMVRMALPGGATPNDIFAATLRATTGASAK